jgi:hypothetical protein
MEVNMEIKLTDPNGNQQINVASVNMQSGVLSKNNIPIGKLQATPIDAFISAIDSGTRPMPAAEKLVWEFVVANPDKFIGG